MKLLDRHTDGQNGRRFQPVRLIIEQYKSWLARRDNLDASDKLVWNIEVKGKSQMDRTDVVWNIKPQRGPARRQDSGISPINLQYGWSNPIANQKGGTLGER